MSEENKVGRKRKYSYEELLHHVEKFALERVGEEITLAELTRYSGIPRHIWKYNDKIREVIERLNKQTIYVDSQNVELTTLPNVEELIENNYNNKEKLTKALKSYSNYINDLYEQALQNKSLKEKIQELENEVESYKIKLEKANEDADFYKEEMKRMAISSTSLKEREEKNIKENVIKLSSKNKDFAGATADKMEKLIGDIF